MFKRIKAFFDNKRRQRFEEIETVRKQIRGKLPDNSFSKKLYSFKGLDREIALLKIGRKVFDISDVRKKNLVGIKVKSLQKLNKKNDLSKATFIHTHIVKNRKLRFELNESDLILFCQCCFYFQISKFEIFILDKNLIEFKRIFLNFSEKTKEWVNEYGFPNLSDRILQYSLIHSSFDNLLHQKGIRIKEVLINNKS